MKHLPQQSPKILAEKVLPTGKMFLVKYPNEIKGKWVWSNKLPKEAKDSWQEHLSR